MEQSLALEIMAEGECVLLTGPPGSGKTYVLNEFVRRAKRSGKHVAVTATTGLAATHLNGSTIHAWSGIGIHDHVTQNFHENMPKGRLETIRNTDVLIIDEISMLHDYRLDMIDQILRGVRKIDEPFGGIQVILCGDFFQLPPVSRSEDKPSEFVVASRVWQELDPVVCYLTEQHRQEDEALLEILGAMRAGDVRRRHAEALLARQSDKPHNIEATELHTTNVDIDTINHHKLSSLKGRTHTFHMQTTGKEHYVETLKRSCLAPGQLVLKKGALVMCIKNDPERRFVNGSLGTVVGFDLKTGYPKVKLNTGRKIVMEPDTWELRDGDRKRASLAQLPLRLAWAITVHKSQGMTLDAARVDLRRAFVEGMGYVALSRVRSLDTLSLVGINRMALQVSPAALTIDETLRNKSTQDAKRFGHLAERAKHHSKPSTITKKVAGWTEKLAQMRQKYPNAYRPWSADDDEQLVQLFTDKPQVSVEELTKKFGRHPGSIRSRLHKHFGEDAVVDVQ